jgi:hypothetical protein
MVLRTPFKKILFKRSRVVFIKFARKTYLRCSKRVSADLTHYYKYKDFQKYIFCVYKRKECEPVKTRFVIITPLLLVVVVIEFLL